MMNIISVGSFLLVLIHYCANLTNISVIAISDVSSETSLRGGGQPFFPASDIYHRVLSPHNSHAKDCSAISTPPSITKLDLAGGDVISEFPPGFGDGLSVYKLCPCGNKLDIGTYNLNDFRGNIGKKFFATTGTNVAWLDGNEFVQCLRTMAKLFKKNGVIGDVEEAYIKDCAWGTWDNC